MTWCHKAPSHYLDQSWQQQWGPVTFIWLQFPMKCLWYQSHQCVENFPYYNHNSQASTIYVYMNQYNWVAYLLPALFPRLSPLPSCLPFCHSGGGNGLGFCGRLFPCGCGLSTCGLSFPSSSFDGSLGLSPGRAACCTATSYRSRGRGATRVHCLLCLLESEMKCCVLGLFCKKCVVKLGWIYQPGLISGHTCWWPGEARIQSICKYGTSHAKLPP